MDKWDQRKKKSEQKNMRDDEERRKGLDTCEVLVCPVLEFGMDHINNLKVKDIRRFFAITLGQKSLRGSQRKCNLCKT